MRKPALTCIVAACAAFGHAGTLSSVINFYYSAPNPGWGFATFQGSKYVGPYADLGVYEGHKITVDSGSYADDAAAGSGYWGIIFTYTQSYDNEPLPSSASVSAISSSRVTASYELDPWSSDTGFLDCSASVGSSLTKSYGPINQSPIKQTANYDSGDPEHGGSLTPVSVNMGFTWVKTSDPHVWITAAQDICDVPQMKVDADMFDPYHGAGFSFSSSAAYSYLLNPIVLGPNP